MSLKERHDEVLNLLRGFGFSSFKSEFDEIPQVVITNHAHEIEELKSTLNFELMLANDSTSIKKINLQKIMQNYIHKIYPIIEKDSSMFGKMREIFHEDSLYEITGLPF